MESSSLSVQVAPPSADVLLNSANASLQLAKDYVIDSQPMYELAAEDLAAVKASVKQLDEQRLSLKRPLMEVASKIDALFAKPIDVRKEAVRVIESGMLGYRQEQKRIADEQRRVVEEAQRVERERIRAEAEEQQRKAREEADRIRQEAETKAASSDNLEEIERIQHEANERAVQVAAQGDQAVAVAETVAAVMTAPVVAGFVPKAAGASVSTRYKAEVVDLMKLVKAIAAGEAPLALIKADDVTLNRMATALKDTMSFPGVRVFPVEGITSRRAA